MRPPLNGRRGGAFPYARVRTSFRLTRSCATSSPSRRPRLTREPSGAGHDLHVAPRPPPPEPAARAARQRRRSRQRPLSRVERVRPGLWSIPVPLPNNSLRYVLVYLFETDRGPVPHRCGLEHRRGLRRAAERHEGGRAATSPTCRASWSPTSTPTTTGWPGGSARRRGLDLAAPRRRRAHPRPLRRARRPAGAGRGRAAQAWARPPRSSAAAQRGHAGAVAASIPVRPRRAARGRRPAGGAGLGPEGHLDAGALARHLCFYEARQRLMLSGDHVLPRITPNIPFHPQAGANPLGDLPALARQARALRGRRGPARRTSTASPIWTRRLEELRQHHRDASPRWWPRGGGAHRLGHRVADGWSRPWDEIAGFMRRPPSARPWRTCASSRPTAPSRSRTASRP